jgi:nicotinamidase-related amidase
MVIMRILSENTIGLIIDYQERLLPHMHEKQQLTENSIILIEGLKALGTPVIITEQYRKGLGSTVTEISGLFPVFNPLEKVSFSCCDDQGINRALTESGRRFVVICGIESHVCVLQTAIDLIEKNFTPVVITDCISSRRRHDKKTAVERMKQEGILIASYESILFELCRFAGTDQFRAISKLVK